MIDLLAAHLALRNRALAFAGPATGTMALAATADGYSRATGSFVTDGFQVGMEITPAGFATNTVDTIKSVTATNLYTVKARAVEVSAGSRSISVGLPALRAWEGDVFTPTIGRQYIDEDFSQDTSVLLGARDGGQVQEQGLYVLKWYGLTGYGMAGLRKSVDTLKLLFAPGTSLTAGSNVVRVRTDIAPNTGGLVHLASGYSVLVLTVPWWSLTTNAIAA